MGIEMEAENVREVLFDEIGNELYAVGWYDSDAEPRTGAVHMNDEFTEAVSVEGDEHTVLNNALLSRIAPSSHEMLNEQQVASTNIFQKFVDIHVHLDDNQGIVVAVEREKENQILDILSLIQKTLPKEMDLLTD
jgi:hypothetical protein